MTDAIRPLAALAVRRVRIVAAHAAIGRVAVHHRIHVPGGDAEEQVRAAERLERIGAVPVGLGDDAHAETLRLEHPADDGHAEAGVIDVSVAGDDDDVAAVPAERVHFLPGHGQERSRPEAGRPSGGGRPLCRVRIPSRGAECTATLRWARIGNSPETRPLAGRPSAGGASVSRSFKASARPGTIAAPSGRR